MENNYDLLKKHFQKETSIEEEKKVNEFKKNNLQEYLLLKQLWWSNMEVKIKDFDSNMAWQNVLAKANKKKTKTISIYTRLRRVAAVAIILIASALTIYVINSKLSPNELIVQTNQSERGNEIVLSDGSKIWLNKNSKITYPETFKGKTRRVSLNGEAYFEIAKNPNKPFIVETDHSEVKVLGTSFNIATDSLQTVTSVATGKVNVKSNYSNSSVNLLPDDMATVSKNALQKSQITNPNYLSWKTGVFHFEDTPLHDVVRDLNTFYNKTIVLKSTNQEQLFSAHFDNTKLEDIIEILEITLNLTILETPNNYEIN
ncbi:MAG: FecR family protein [Prolixibacteraceae bacterium]